MKYAVLIDSENAQPRLDDIFQELSKYGDTPIRYLIGDFTKPSIAPWLEVCKKHAITCIQTMNFTNGKNSLDISLVIEGMKILYEKEFIDGLIIVASDSDYTPLAREWRNAGKDVIGIGRKNSTESYRSSCNSFIYVENIFGGDIDRDIINLTPADKIGEIMNSVLNDNNGKTLLSIVVSAVRKAYSDFDVRNYGYQKAIDFFKGEFDNVELIKEDARTYSIQFKHNDEVAKKPLKNIKEAPKKNNKKDVAKESRVESKNEAKAPIKDNKAKIKKGKKEAKLTLKDRNEIISLYKGLLVNEISINDFAQVLNKHQIKCKNLGFLKVKDMLGSISEFNINGDTLSLKELNATHVYVEEANDDSIDF